MLEAARNSRARSRTNLLCRTAAPYSDQLHRAAVGHCHCVSAHPHCGTLCWRRARHRRGIDETSLPSAGRGTTTISATFQPTGTHGSTARPRQRLPAHCASTTRPFAAASQSSSLPDVRSRSARPLRTTSLSVWSADPGRFDPRAAPRPAKVSLTSSTSPANRSSTQGYKLILNISVGISDLNCPARDTHDETS